MEIVTQVLALTDDCGKWTAHTRELIGDAAKVARQLKGRVAGWVLSATANDQTPSIESLQELANYGCPVVHGLGNARFAHWSSESIGAALAAKVAASCRVVFLPGTPQGEEVAACLATRMATIWVPDAISVSITRAGVQEITAVEPGGRLSRIYRLASERSVVITMRPGVAEARLPEAATEVVVKNVAIDLSDVPQLTQAREFLPADPKTIDITQARRIVSGGRGTGGHAGMQLIRSLADTLAAAPAASRMAVDLGWASPQRQVGQTGKTVQPDLYVACGISGASHHVAGMRESKHIVAINSDPCAPIHDVAHLSLVGDLQEVIPAIITAVDRRTVE